LLGRNLLREPLLALDLGVERLGRDENHISNPHAQSEDREDAIHNFAGDLDDPCRCLISLLQAH
jgi:hypothetical protein